MANQRVIDDYRHVRNEAWSEGRKQFADEIHGRILNIIEFETQRTKDNIAEHLKSVAQKRSRVAGSLKVIKWLLVIAAGVSAGYGLCLWA